jgi:hypothetical protein
MNYTALSLLVFTNLLCAKALTHTLETDNHNSSFESSKQKPHGTKLESTLMVKQPMTIQDSPLISMTTEAVWSLHPPKMMQEATKPAVFESLSIKPLVGRC